MSYTQDQMIAMFNRLQQSLIDRVTDSGWVDIQPSGYNVIFTAGTIRARKIGNVVTLEIYNLRTSSNLSGTIRIVNNLGIFTPKYDKTFTVSAIPGSGVKYGGIMVLRPNGILELQVNDPYAPDYGLYGTITYMTD